MPVPFLSIPSTYRDWWSVTMPVWRTSVDQFGHVTATHYAALFEEVAMEFVCSVLGQEDPSYVTAQQTIDYRAELLHRRTPITVHVAISRLDATSFDVRSVLVDTESTVSSTAKFHDVAWSREARGRRALDASDYVALSDHLAN